MGLPEKDDATSKLASQDSRRVTPALGKEASASIVSQPPLSWRSIKQEIIPPYVRAVSFTVAQNDLNPARQEDLTIRFPNVTIVSEVPLEEAIDQDETECEYQIAADRCLRQVSTTDIAPITSPETVTTDGTSLELSTTSVTEAVPKPSLLSRMSFGAQTRVASADIDNVDNSTSPIKTHSKSPILSIAESIDMKLSCPVKVIHAMWLQWHTSHQVKSFASVRRLVNLDQYYSNLVTLYILAYHKAELDLCFSILLRFQNTNYTFRGGLPEIATAVLAFQYLPEEDGLCRWVAMLFAFLWGTQQYQSREHLLTEIPDLNHDALSKLLFAIAHIRDPFTKGHNTAVLDRWCEVHQHKEGDEEEALCKEMYDAMKVKLDVLRSEEAERHYQEAKDVVDEYVQSLRSQSLNVDTLQSTVPSMVKRKAESPVTQPHQKYRRGGARGSGRGRTSKASS